MSKCLQIHDSGASRTSSPVMLLRQPKCMGSFSLDRERAFHPDRRNLKYINTNRFKRKPARVHFDLNDGIDVTIRRDKYLSSKEKLDTLLKWILLKKSKFFTEHSRQNGFTSLSTDFVCFRGLLTKFMCTPYERNEEWIVHAIKWHGTIYMLNIYTDQHRQYLANQTAKDEQMSAWGYKFEQYMTTFPTDTSDTSDEDAVEPVNQNEEYNCVLRTRLGYHSMLYSAEVDGVDKKLYKKGHRDLRAFIELKTTNRIFNQRQAHSFRRYKMKKWFCQSHLSGVPTLVCGYKCDNMVYELEKFDVNEIAFMCKSFWSKDVMLHFLNRFLHFVRATVVEERPAVYEFRTSLSSNCIYGKKASDAQDFLPDWYTSCLFEEKKEGETK